MAYVPARGLIVDIPRVSLGFVEAGYASGEAESVTSGLVRPKLVRLVAPSSYVLAH